MASVPLRKASQVKGPAKKTSFLLAGPEKEDEKPGDDKAATSTKPKFNCVAKKIVMANRIFLPPQRKISRVNSGSPQTDAGGNRYGNSSSSDCDETSRSTVKEMAMRENTYKMGPDSKFLPDDTKKRMETILKKRLEGKNYATSDATKLCALLSDEIKAAVRESAALDRHKLVCVVYIGQVLGQGVHVTSRCLWNAKFDAFSSATFHNDNLFAQASIFAVYLEWFGPYTSALGPRWLTFYSQVQKSTFSKKDKCISDVVRMGSIIIFHLSKLWKAKFFVLCDIVFVVRLWGKFEIDHSWEWKG